MAVEHIHPHFRKARTHTDDPDQHAAVVELLVLTVFADPTVDLAELDALDAFDASHADWDDGPFSIQQYLPTATAAVRAALDQPDGRDRLLADISIRITTPALRDATVGYCEDLVAVDGTTDQEREFLRQVRRALANWPTGP
jgi:hypothetical protein